MSLPAASWTGSWSGAWTSAWDSSRFSGWPGSCRAACGARGPPVRRRGRRARIGADRPAGHRIAVVPRRDVGVQVGHQVAEQLVVHLERAEDAGDRATGVAQVGEEALALGRGQLVRLAD